MKLVIHPPVEADRLARIVEAASPMQVVNAASEAEASAAMPDAEAFFGKITAPMLANAPKLRWVQAPTVSLEHYIFPELEKHPCVLTNMRGLFSDVIADQVMGYVICFARNLHTYVRQQMEGKWAPVGGEGNRVDNRKGPGVVNDIDRAHMHIGGATMGIVGFGAIGSEIAKRALAFGMRVIGVDPLIRPVPPGVTAIWRIGKLYDLLEQSDFVVLATPHTPETEKSVGYYEFKHMKRSAYFINIGRGATVVLEDLVKALAEKRLAGAALDVFENEPLPAEHPLWKMPNVIITPHVAGYSPKIAERHLALLLDNIRRFVKGEEPQNMVSKAMWF
jgi:phosphoglycerate dehydrogenase-like enzyme